MSIKQNNGQHSILAPAEILLPKSGTDMTKWSVVACDQFTAQPSYWQQLESQIGDSPSSLNLILPECYLGKADEQARTQRIFETMRRYIEDGLFAAHIGCVLVSRQTAYGNTRTGLVAALDLDAYDYAVGTQAPVRATEGTVIERIPPRVKIRESCVMELPHIILLANDPDNLLLRAAEASATQTLYDFDLSGGGGHVSGKRIEDVSGVSQALDTLIRTSQSRYGSSFGLAVGDGNHSLAAAKECYERAKRAGAEDSTLEKLRYALVEVENIYDRGLQFEPIHRLVIGADSADFFAAYNRAAQGKNFTGQTRALCGDTQYTIPLSGSAIEGVRFVQEFLDDYKKTHAIEIDYIHGQKDLEELSQSENHIGIFLHAMDKSELFDYIAKNGVLPRKTFSMGEASEKRYYLEGRKIR